MFLLYFRIDTVRSKVYIVFTIMLHILFYSFVYCKNHLYISFILQYKFL